MSEKIPDGEHELMMAFDDKENPKGLLMDHENGLYVRADQTWYVVSQNNPFFSGSIVMPVEDEFLEVFDRLDKKGNTPTHDQAASYALKEGSEQ